MESTSWDVLEEIIRQPVAKVIQHGTCVSPGFGQQQITCSIFQKLVLDRVPSVNSRPLGWYPEMLGQCIGGEELVALEPRPAALRGHSTVLDGKSQSWEEVLRNS